MVWSTTTDRTFSGSWNDQVSRGVLIEPRHAVSGFSGVLPVPPQVDLVPRKRHDIGVPHYDIFAGEQLVGVIGQPVPFAQREVWSWALNTVMVDNSIGIPIKGLSESLDKAKAYFRRRSTWKTGIVIHTKGNRLDNSYDFFNRQGRNRHSVIEECSKHRYINSRSVRRDRPAVTLGVFHTSPTQT